MLIIPIKRKWLEMIRHNEKQEEYRALTPYYSTRFRKFFTYRPLTNAQTIAVIRAASSKGGIPVREIVLRAGYSLLSPAIMVKGTLVIGEGKPEWGAEPGKEYYIIRIEEVEDLITDSKSYARDGDTPFQLIDCQEEENKGDNNTGDNTADNTGGNE